MKKYLLLFFLFQIVIAFSQSYPPQAGAMGSTAIFKDSPLYVAWAAGITVTRGYVNLSDTAVTAAGSNLASSGNPENALGYPDGNTVSLGDRGEATLTFTAPITDGPGFDFAVFENGGVGYLELAFVEVSSDGVHFFRFPSHSQTQTAMQIGSFGTPSATYLSNLAGKYAAEYGTPFDIGELADNDFLDKANVNYVKIIDVVGSINPDFASYDSFGNAINDSFPTPFASAGFDLQAVGVIHQLTLGTDGFKNREVIYLYPNPAKDRLYFHTDWAIDVKVMDMFGRIVLSKQNVKGEGIDVSTLKPGIYTVKVMKNNRSDILPLIMK